MEGAAGGGGTGGAGPAPFLIKTYDMVDESATDKIVSWTSSKKSFVVWNPPEFARLLLPTFFKHNNFSSFIRQLNTYGFKKIDSERWEFANDDFIKDQKHLLKNIHRRKPIHSHSTPPGSLGDPERAAFEDEIDRLSRKKTTLEADISRFKQQKSTAKTQLQDLTVKVESMEKRQKNLLAFLEKAVQNPSFVEHLARRVESMDFTAFNKKRRLPSADHSQPVLENSFLDNHSSSRSGSGNIFHQDFSHKMRLETSSVSDINLLSCSTQSSNEGGGSSQRNMSKLDTRGVQESHHFAAETLDLSDTGTSFVLKRDSSLSGKSPNDESPCLHSLQPNVSSKEDGESHISCHLNLTLASSSLRVNDADYLGRMPQLGQNLRKSSGSKVNSNGKESDMRLFTKNINLDEGTTTLCLKETSSNNHGPPANPVRVNDVFWEQFLTERPGCPESEEASSNYRENLYKEPDEGRSGLSL
ncbi:heat stress transcription factor A-5-like [Cucurbita pepo subsp. pepo]|uniref:heat stress transcription factor A-5-like n=1 Tax=Cucurbita pepo subsp. pepo TaxID=3664 RepID=UPI000C9D6AE2|nr:heat stress transcription factor A-5-like [Cucurbita pepo subsp. pepo]